MLFSPKTKYHSTLSPDFFRYNHSETTIAINSLISLNEAPQATLRQPE